MATLAAVFSIALGTGRAADAAPDTFKKPPDQTSAELQKRIAWWKDAKFGMFIGVAKT